MRWPLVWRSTYDALADRFERSVTFRLEMERRAEESYAALDDANGRIEDYKRAVETRDAIIAGMRHEIDAAETRLGGVKAANDLLRSDLANRDEIIANHRADAVDRDATILRQGELIIRQLDELEQCKRTIAELTATPAKSKRSRVDEACRAQARRPDGGIDPALLRVFRARATELRRKDKNEQEICEAIENGWQVTTGAPSAEEIVSRFTDEG